MLFMFCQKIADGLTSPLGVAAIVKHYNTTVNDDKGRVCEKTSQQYGFLETFVFHYIFSVILMNLLPNILSEISHGFSLM